MAGNIKAGVKKFLSAIGLWHPSLGIKISAEEKAHMLLKHKGARSVFVETGTHKGDMLKRMSGAFRVLYSIELDDLLYGAAVERFRIDTHVHLFHGDSRDVLKRVVTSIKEPALFWLDAHAPGEITASNSPIMTELETIFSHPIKTHVILIDDARHFDPVTITKIERLAKSEGFTFSIISGIFVIS